MKFKEIVAPSIRELFIQQIEGMILSGQLRPGDRLPTERELADEMKISKTVVHESIRELHRLGFLDVASRQGVTVADYAQTGNLETLLAIMRYHGGRLDEKTAGSLLAVRSYIECPALEALAAHHTDGDLKKLELLQEEARRSIDDPAAFADMLFRYHRTVAFLSGNTITPLILNAFAPVSMNFWMGYIHAYGPEICLEQLEAFTDCIRRGDGRFAAAMLRQGLMDYGEKL